MMEQRAGEVLKSLAFNPHLASYIDSTLPIPKVHRGRGNIRLVILGQDPTVKRAESRANVKTVLNLDRKNVLRRYLEAVCVGLGLRLDVNVYATNYLKNFFIEPPAQIKEIDILDAFTPHWLPLLQYELSQFPEVPVITLGEPLLGAIVIGGASPKVRDYWGYTQDWKEGKTGPLKYSPPENNILGRVVFPFPHQPSIGKQFYSARLSQYVKYVGQHMAEFGES